MPQAVKIILIILGVIFLWWAFHRNESLFAFCTFRIASHALGTTVGIIRGLFFGYVGYALVAVYGSIGRISTFGDVLTILSARPSQVGGPGVIGVIFGIWVAIIAFGTTPVWTGGSKIQGRTIRFEVIRITFVRSVERVLKKLSR